MSRKTSSLWSTSVPGDLFCHLKSPVKQASLLISKVRNLSMTGDIGNGIDPKMESGYREKALKLYPWVCGRCSREFVYSNLRELTVHHIDHDHTNNPEDGSNWELLCLYCHDHEHSKYTEADQYGTNVVAGEDAQKDVAAATYNPFADLKSMLNKK
jgi:hypothetical protein